MASSAKAFVLLLAVAVAIARPALSAPPDDLSNFQNEFACISTGASPAPLLVRPLSLADARQAVRSFSLVRAVGAGHSWNAPFFCPGSSGNATIASTVAAAAGIAMSSIRPLRITVDEEAQTVTADAGVVVADLLSFLANYATPRSPAGYTLPAFPWFVYQTVGGAVATGTHGSSVPDASLSAQLEAVDLIVSDGSLRRFTSASDPFLMRAVRVSAGRLGVIARVTLRVVREEPVRRQLRLLGERDFLGLLREAQDAWNAAGGAREGTGLPPAATEPAARREALLARAQKALPRWAMDGQAFWLPERRSFYLVTFTRASEAGCDLFGEGGEMGDGVGAPPPIVVAADATANGSNETKTKSNRAAACADFLRRYRPQQTTQYNSSRAAFSPTGHELAVPASGAGGDLLSLGDALRPLAPSSSSLPLFPFASSLPALRSLADRKLTKQTNSSGGGGGPEGAAWPPPKRLLRPSGPYAAQDGTALSQAGITFVSGNATAEATDAFIRQPEQTLAPLRQAVFTQYEAAVPLSTAADCVAELTRVVAAESARAREDAAAAAASANGTAALPLLIAPHNTTSTTGFFTAPLLRFVGPEDALLSLSGLDHGVALFINMEDYLGPRAAGGCGDDGNDGGADNNPAFKRAMAVLRGAPQCAGARLHLGKAGWPARGCWRGDKEYGDRWCDFGCAVRALRAEDKFASAAPDRWTWAGVDLEACCDGGERGGFLAAKPGCVCRVEHARANCPPAPFY